MGRPRQADQRLFCSDFHPTSQCVHLDITYTYTPQPFDPSFLATVRSELPRPLADLLRRIVILHKDAARTAEAFEPGAIGTQWTDYRIKELFFSDLTAPQRPSLLDCLQSGARGYLTPSLFR